MIKSKKLKTIFKSTKNKIIAAVAAGILVLILIIVLIICNLLKNSAGEVVYKDTTAQYGDLTVGVTEDSTVDIGTVEQTFDLDISSLVTSDSSSSSTTSTTSSDQGAGMGMGGGGTDMFSQLFNLASGNTSTTTTDSGNTMDIESVLVTIGQRIEVGDVLFTITQDSIDAIRDKLASDVAEAKTALDEVVTDQVSTKLDAKHTYESSLAYGGYAKTEYDAAIATLNDIVSTTESELTLATQELATLNQNLTDLKTEYAAAVTSLNAAQSNVDLVNKDTNTYWYMQYEAVRESAASYADSLETSVENTETSIDKAEDNVTTLTTKLSQAKRDLASGLLQAKETYDLRLLAYNNAKETYDVATAYLDENQTDAQSTYDDAVDKLSEFDDYIVNQSILSEYSGVVTDVALAAGDTVSMDSSMITLYDDEAVTMTATVEEDDMTDIALGNEVNISLTAYDDQILTGIVSEISDATYNSNTGVNEYSVTVTLQGDVSGLYQGMSGEVTFITKQSSEVVYVSNRAIFRDGTKSYVKVKDENGNITNKEVTTGFSDGVNVEIVEGLSKGDTVLIESKVSE